MTDAAKAGAQQGGIMADDDGHTGPARSGGAPAGPDPQTPGRRAGLSELAQTRLGAHLRTLYDGVLRQPVPDRFRDLIDSLDSGKPKPP